MQAIRRKLNSQRGASMMMALLLMLVGIMVSAVIISAATSAAVNKRSEKEQQQAYLAVSSAAELVRDDFQSLTGRYKDVTTTVTILVVSRGQLCRRARARRFPKPYGPV